MTDLTDESVKALLDGATPGAWAVNPKAATNVEAGRRGVAACGGYFDNTSDGAYAVENEANARLIAAAPDMHATILSLYDEMERLRGLLDRRGVGKAERYWEGRWRDEKAENDRLIAAFKRIEDAGIGGFLTPDLVAEITLEALGQEEDA